MSTPFSPLWNGNLFQNSLYVGINISSILYGMELLLYFKTMRAILFNFRKMRRTSVIFYVLFSTMILFLITVWVATQAEFGQQMWLLNPDFPGGADAYWQKHIADWYLDWGTTAIIVLQLMADALMINRCRIVWDSYRVTVVPVLLWLVTLALGLLMDLTSSTPGGNIFLGTASRLGLAYWTVSIFLATILTCAICYRLVQHGKKVQKHLGCEYASLYFTIITIVIESVLPYALSGIAFLVSFGLGSSTSVVFGSVHILTMCISQQWLILRVVMGRAYETMSKPRNSTVRFDPVNTSVSEPVDSVHTRVYLQSSSDVSLPSGHDKV